MCSNANSDSDSTDTDAETTLTDDELFDLDIVDGEDPSRAVDPNDRSRSDPPGPSIGTRFARLQDGSFAIIERGALGAWISADETVSLEDAR